MRRALDLLELVQHKQVILCCGSGGVGKTTSAAALGLLAAAKGRRVLVMTIDPAKRLAQALGLEELGHDPQQINLQCESQGAMFAMMLDTKIAFDELVTRYAPSEEVKQRIFNNSYYQHFSTSLAGSREFMAMEKVYEVVSDGRYDLLIVDTPPAQHALEFLEAPHRLFDLFEGAFVNLLVQPYKLAGKLGFEFFRRSSAPFLKLFERLTGYEVLNELSEFFLAFSGMFEGFKERSKKVDSMLHQTTTSFLLVCSPEPASLVQADGFFEYLEREGLSIGGLLINRVHSLDVPSETRLSDAAMEQLRAVPDALLGGESLEQRLFACYREEVMLRAADMGAIHSAQITSGKISFRCMPYFEHDLHSLEDLDRFAAHFLDSESVAEADTEADTEAGVN